MSAIHPRKRLRDSNEEAPVRMKKKQKDGAGAIPLKRGRDDEDDGDGDVDGGRHHARARLGCGGAESDHAEAEPAGTSDDREKARFEEDRPRMSYLKRRRLELLKQRAAVAEMSGRYRE
ncbi:hypothetical protein DFH09DRAFT_1328033 [Mycena vulgaris]|nr:hypothetical protein DFH09DRAFT_1328033 [Mycena vulgaris]